MALNTNALTTLNQAKNWLKIPLATVTDDSLVELLINAASQTIESETNRKLLTQLYTELRHGKSGNIIVTRHWPITAVTSVKFDNSGVFTDPSTLVDATEYKITDDGQSITFLSTTVPKGYGNIQVVYTAGYTTTPSDLEMACLWLVAWMYQLRKGDNIGRASKGKSDESDSWSQSAPDYVKDIIMKYKRTEFPLGDAIERNS